MRERVGQPPVLGSPSVRLKINFLVVAWKDGFFCVWWLLVGSGGTPPPMTGLLESILYLGSPARSLRNKDLLVKSLFFFHLGTFPPPVLALGWWAFASSRLGPPFRPDQKVKLDKTEARRRGPFLVSWLFGLRCRLSGGPLLEKREKWRTPQFFQSTSKDKPALYSPS
jgi:hypothetical protein